MDDPLAVRALLAAPLLIGARLARDSADGRVVVRITEVEAYEGAEDPGSHAHRGITPRNRSMFGPSGTVYVYRSYGLHFCVNIVCGHAGEASACLVRAGEVVEGAGIARMRRLAVRGAKAAGSTGSGRGRDALPDRELARGPGNLARALGVLPEDDGLSARSAPFSLELPREPAGDEPSGQSPPPISRGLRTGVAAPGGLPPFHWRLWATGDATVSRYVPHASVRATASPRPSSPSRP